MSRVEDRTEGSGGASAPSVVSGSGGTSATGYRLIATPEARPALTEWLRQSGTLSAAAGAQPRVSTLRGRGTVPVVPAPPGPWPAEMRWVVRHYHRGGAVASLLGDRYPRGPVPRPVREFEAIRAAGALGIPTVRAVGAVVYPAGLFYRGDLVTEWVPDSVDLADVLFGTSSPGGFTPAATMGAAGRLVRLMHENGLMHPDLNIKNVLIAPGKEGPRALIVDLDRARLRSRALSTRARERGRARFRRSLRKWQKRIGGGGPGDVPVPEWMDAFDRGYEAPPR